MLGRLFNKWASATQTKELQHFVTSLGVMDSSELGLIVACATDWRHKLEAEGWDLLDPAICLAKDLSITFTLSRTIRRLQNSGSPQLAAGLMVWVHTLRAMTRPELRALGRSMWRQLERGFPYAATTANDASLFFGLQFDARDAARFPIGLSPDPL